MPNATAEPVRVLVVDDEPLARRGIRLHLERAGGFAVVGEAATAAEGAAMVAALAPQAVFLDVQMPGGDGFSLVERVGAAAMPVTVFVTAHDAHALRAFEAQALDYVLKPLDSERFARAAERVRALVQAGAAPRRLLLRDGATTLCFAHDDVAWVAADGDYVRVMARGRSHLVRHTIGSLAARLDPRRFVRVHRSALVNVDWVREVRPDGDRRARVVLRDGTVVPVSRGSRDALAAALVIAHGTADGAGRSPALANFLPGW